MATIVEKRAQNEAAVLFICDFSPPRGPDPGLLEPANGSGIGFGCEVRENQRACCGAHALTVEAILGGEEYP